MKKIRSNSGHFAIVDDEDFEMLSKHRWCLSAGRYFHTYNPKTKKNILMHRVIMGDDNSMKVDHINHNTTDNRKSNLRLCTGAQNSRNKLKTSNPKTSKYNGVHFDKSRNKWKVDISLNNKYFLCKRFNTEKEADIFYNAKAKEIYGEFAHLNKIP